MLKRTIEISRPARLFVKMGQLFIEHEGAAIGQAPIEDLGILILAHPAISITQAVIANCLAAKCVIVFCDKKFLPISVVLPLWSNNLYSKILRDQINLSRPAEKRLWRQVVIGKIEAQARTLKSLSIPSDALKGLIPRVKSGDPNNIEAQAARVYWALLFGDTFRRDRDLSGINMLLNYGYAVLRAAVARALCGSGLNPALGIHHHNQYDSLCLADDLMEPLRPAVDSVVHRLAKNNPDMEIINQHEKTVLIGLLNQSFFIQKKTFPLLVALQYYTASFKDALTLPDRRLEIPLL